jgi:hypothetical protein
MAVTGLVIRRAKVNARIGMHMAASSRDIGQIAYALHKQRRLG